MKRAAAPATFAISKSSIGAFFCTLCRCCAFFLLEPKPGVGGVRCAFFLLEPTPGVGGVLFLFLRLDLCVGVASTPVDGLIPVPAGGEVDAAFASTPILAVSFVSIVVAPAAFLRLMFFSTHSL